MYNERDPPDSLLPLPRSPGRRQTPQSTPGFYPPVLGGQNHSAVTRGYNLQPSKHLEGVTLKRASPPSITRAPGEECHARLTQRHDPLSIVRILASLQRSRPISSSGFLLGEPGRAPPALGGRRGLPRLSPETPPAGPPPAGPGRGRLTCRRRPRGPGTQPAAWPRCGL